MQALNITSEQFARLLRDHNLTREQFIALYGLRPLVYTPELPARTKLAFLLTGVLIFALALFGNALVVYVVTRSKAMHTVTNIFICSLALSDLLITFFCIPVTMLQNIWDNWLGDHDYLENIYGMFKKVNASERIVGWYRYRTGRKLWIELHAAGYLELLGKSSHGQAAHQPPDHLPAALPFAIFNLLPDVSLQEEFTKAFYLKTSNQIDGGGRLGLSRNLINKIANQAVERKEGQEKEESKKDRKDDKEKEKDEEKSDVKKEEKKEKK
ncbi:Pyroglutamylated RFamide peptide receptor [Fukomys damarensis]|uniref:Pyroglutamylated RFamide peptide receptor n=1 Tax=Fukomys damarensis TaxID=885580 RepID=A0A091E0D3_FUKDA|nr:Pyroglutamylated RFamide peptide receptor [Fukomys damarensis]